ncbi:MAG TPA: HEAT repeat domain-containing protein [Armatimonadetes bacterium]|nr:HEAT repeat domain-containing protein [Armatimonadota bacterium]
MDVIEELVQQLGSDDEVTRMQAGEMLVNIGRAAVKPLIAALESHDHPARHMVAATLGYLGDKRAVPVLIEALKDDDHLVRLHAAAALGKLRDTRAVEPLIHALFDAASHVDVDPFTGDALTVRAAAAQSLGDLRDARAVPALIAALKDPNRSVRRAAVQALAHLRDERAVSALLELLDDENDIHMQQLIVRAIARIGSAHAQQVLSELAHEDAREAVKQTAQEVLAGEHRKHTKLKVASESIHARPSAPIKSRRTSYPILSAIFGSAALLSAGGAIFWIVDQPVRALILLVTALILAILSVASALIWRRREQLRRLEFTLKRSRDDSLTSRAAKKPK